MIPLNDNLCEQRYFMTDFDNQGIKQKVPNYKQALTTNVSYSKL